MKSILIMVLSISLILLVTACAATPVAILPTSTPLSAGQSVTPEPGFEIALATATDIPSEVTDPDLYSNIQPEDGLGIIGFDYAYCPLLDGSTEPDEDRWIELGLYRKGDDAVFVIDGEEKRKIGTGEAYMEQLTRLIHEHGMTRWGDSAPEEENAVYRTMIYWRNGESLCLSASLDALPENMDIAHSAILALFDKPAYE